MGTVPAFCDKNITLSSNLAGECVVEARSSEPTGVPVLIQQFEVRNSHAAVPEARRFVGEVLLHGGLSDLTDAAELVATELVTNALLHGSPPIRLVVLPGSRQDATRIEVRDGSPRPPLLPLPGVDAMTGRGLGLVGALSSCWGVDTAEDGKLVWAELTAASARRAEARPKDDLDIDQLLRCFDDRPDELADDRFTVTLGDVPTDLLLAAKAHVDSLVRELTLSAAGASSGVSGGLPRHLAALVHDVVNEFSDARETIKRQAIAAAGRGEGRTHLTLVLRAEAVDAGERYLAALEEADVYARASRLLTLEAPPQHRAFRRWYVSSLLASLRATSAGAAGSTRPPTFESYLLAEVDHLAALQRESDRTARLQRVTAKLATVMDSRTLLEHVVHEAVAELGASRGGIVLVGEAEPQEYVQVGYSRQLLELNLADWRAGVATPARCSLDTGMALWLESVDERENYTGFADHEPDTLSSCNVPLQVAGRALGVLTLSFTRSRLFTDDDRRYLVALAALAGQSLERVRSSEQAAAANQRLRLLARISARLGADLDGEQTLAELVKLFVPEFADICTVHVLHDGELTLLELAHGDPDRRQAALAVHAARPERLAGEGVGLVVRSGTATLGTPPARSFGELGMNSMIVVPMTARDRPLGALSFACGVGRPAYGNDDLAFAMDVATRAAVTLDDARLVWEVTQQGLRRGLPEQYGDGADRDPGPAGVPSGPRLTDTAMTELGGFSVTLYEDRVELDDRLATFLGCGQGGPASRLQLARQLHPDDIERARDAMAAAITTRSEFDCEFRMRLPSGAVPWITARGKIVMGADGLEVMAGVMYDSTATRRGVDQIARLLQTMSDGYLRVDSRSRVTFLNAQGERALFRTRQELIGRSLWDVFAPTEPTFRSSCERATTTGKQVRFEVFHPTLDTSFEVSVSPDATGLSLFFRDVSERSRAQRAEKVQRDRLALLADATRGLVGTVDVPAVLAGVASVLVPRLADWVVVEAAGSGEQPRTVRSSHVDPGCSRELVDLTRRGEGVLQALPAMSRVLAGGAPELIVGLPAGKDDAITARLGYSSALVVPLQCGDSTLGAFCAVRGPTRPPFTADEADTANDIAGRAALALQNAQLHVRQQRTAEVLQRSLLTALPAPDGLRLAARYRPAASYQAVGGDWYDAFVQPDGASTLVVGDVVGHDLRAAAVMGQLRNLLRGTAYAGPASPAEVLSSVDEIIRGLQVDTLATAIVCRLEQSSAPGRGARLLLSSAGHPPAMVRDPDGSVRVLVTEDDVLLGLDAASARHDHVATLAPDATLLLYTDGLVERRGTDLSRRLTRLSQAFSRLGQLPLEELCDALLLEMVPDAPEDDVVLLAARPCLPGS